MTDDSEFVKDSDSVPAPRAPCKCVFTHRRHKQERDIYREV